MLKFTLTRQNYYASYMLTTAAYDQHFIYLNKGRDQTATVFVAHEMTGPDYSHRQIQRFHAILLM